MEPVHGHSLVQAKNLLHFIKVVAVGFDPFPHHFHRTIFRLALAFGNHENIAVPLGKFMWLIAAQIDEIELLGTGEWLGAVPDARECVGMVRRKQPQVQR